MANSRGKLAPWPRWRKKSPKLEDKQSRDRLEFKTDAKEYSVSELYVKFQHSLPLVVIVKQRYFGDIFCCKLNRRQILYINAIAKQKRAVAMFVSPTGPKLLSIPESFPEKFTVLTGSKGTCENQSKMADTDDKEQSMYLQAILRTRTLPFLAQLSKGQIIQSGGRQIKTDDVPPFHLTRAFDEISLLGNRVHKVRIVTSDAGYKVCAEVNPEVLEIPVHLSQLRFAVVTGIVNQSDAVWESFLHELKRLSAEIEYNKNSGHIGIAEYSTDSFQPGIAYTFVQPKSYVDILSLTFPQRMEHKDTTKNNTDDTADTDVHEVLDKLDSNSKFKAGEVGNKSRTEMTEESNDNEYENMTTNKGDRIGNKSLVKTTEGTLQTDNTVLYDKLDETALRPTNRADEDKATDCTYTNEITQEIDNSALYEDLDESTMDPAENVSFREENKDTLEIDNTDVYEDLDESTMSSTNIGDTFKSKSFIWTTKHAQEPEVTSLKIHSGYEVLIGSACSSMPDISMRTIESDKENEKRIELQMSSSASTDMAETEAALLAKTTSPSGGTVENTTVLEPLYTNNIQETIEFSSSASAESAEVSVHSSDITSSSNSEGQKSQTLKCRISKMNVAMLCIQDVGECLEKLNLKHYIKVFKEQRVDGSLLLELDQEMLKTDFGMTGIEALRLHKFARDGHFPS